VTAFHSQPATYRQLFAVREFRVLFAGFGLYLAGESTMILALSVLVYSTTGSTLLAALAFVSGLLPHVLGGTFLLAFADRWRPRTLISGYALARTALVVVLALGNLSPAAMLALVFAVGTLGPVHSAARTALLADLFDDDAYVLARSLFTVTAGITQVLGYAVGGLLLALTGPRGALWVTAATCLLTAALTRLGLADRPPRATRQAGAVRTTWRVNRALLGDPRIRGLLLAQWIPLSLAVGAEGVLVPYGSEIDQAGNSGVLFMAAAAGMVAGDMVVGRLVRPDRREQLTPWLAALLGVPLLAFAARPGLVAAAVLLATAMFGVGYQLGLARRFLVAVPEQARGQAFGLATTGLMMMQGLGMAGAGALGELVDPSVVIATAGVCSLTATVLLSNRLRPEARQTTN
jgi:MFS family permease